MLVWSISRSYQHCCGWIIYFWFLQASVPHAEIFPWQDCNLDCVFVKIYKRIGTKTSASNRSIRIISRSRSKSLIPLAFRSFLSLNNASRAATNGLKQLIMQLDVSPSVNQRVVQAFKIFKGGRFSTSCALWKIACFTEL